MLKPLPMTTLSIAFAAIGTLGAGKTRLAIVGLDHDHVWGLLTDILNEPEADLVAIADPHPEPVAKAKARVPAGVRFYDDYVRLLDEAKPEAVIVTTENDRHLEILKQCAKRHIHFSTEKPMASNAAEAREMKRLAEQAHIKLMVNYWNAWVAPTHEIFHRLDAGELGPVQKILVEYGHQGPREIGVSKAFADWLYDPAKNGGGALIDFGCYGAEWALWLKGRPSSVYARTLKVKADQHNRVDDDALIVLQYPDATAIIQASWDWPYNKGQVEVYGPRGSLLATEDELFYRAPAESDERLMPVGKPVELKPLPHETSNPVAYFLDCIRNDKPVEKPLSAELNVGVVEILDAAKESIRRGRAVDLRAE
jgi:predicted dehydrogenase